MKAPALALAPALLATIAVSFFAAGQPPAAAPTDPAAPPAVPQYQVEILVFANREFDASEERFSHEPIANGIDATATFQDIPVFDASTFAPADDSAATDATERGFRLLAAEELQLNAEYQKLERISAYTPLLHGGWVQAGLPEGETQPFDLALLGALNPRGSVRVYLARFLHVNLDLTYQGSGGAAAPASSELGELAFAPRFKLVTERNVRSGELHYFDHPAFGVLVKITPVPADATTSTSRRPAA